MIENNLLRVGRLLLALYFLIPGIMKFVAWDRTIEAMQAHSVPSPDLLLPVAAIAQIVGAVLLIINRQTFLVCLGFIAYILVINIMMHDFWNFDDIEGRHELQNFIKNMAIMAGVMVLAGTARRSR